MCHQQTVLQLMKYFYLDHLCILERTVFLKQSPEVHRLVLMTMKIFDHSKEHIEIYDLRKFRGVPEIPLD